MGHHAYIIYTRMNGLERNTKKKLNPGHALIILFYVKGIMLVYK